MTSPSIQSDKTQNGSVADRKSDPNFEMSMVTYSVLTLEKVDSEGFQNLVPLALKIVTGAHQ